MFLAGQRVGTISQAAGLTFRYEEEYRSLPDPTPLSLSMPLSRAEHGNRVTLSWVNGLLPADREVRARIAERGGVRPTNPVALLSVIGLDCPGAVQVAPVDREAGRAHGTATGAERTRVVADVAGPRHPGGAFGTPHVRGPIGHRGAQVRPPTGCGRRRARPRRGPVPIVGQPDHVRTLRRTHGA